MAPPSTPAPSRFLLSKKRPGPSQDQGQGNQQQQQQPGQTPTQTQRAGRQFSATPRFGALSTPRGQSSSTRQRDQHYHHHQQQQPGITTTPAVAAGRWPAFSSSVKTKARQLGDLIDVDSSPQSPEEQQWHYLQQPGPSRRRTAAQGDVIIEDSTSQSQSQSRSHSDELYSSEEPGEGNDNDDDDGDDDDDDDDGQPTRWPVPKRRRITISPEQLVISSPQSDAAAVAAVAERADVHIPEIPETPPSGDEGEGGVEPGDISDGYASRDLSDHQHDHPGAEGGDEGHDSNEEEHISESQSAERSKDDGDGMDLDLESHHRTLASTPKKQKQKQKQKPTFHRAPRFKPANPSDQDELQQHAHLPDVFSPQRRGAKYTPGGLAASVRDWLFQVKGDGPGDDGGPVKIAVEQVKTGPQGMRLVKGRRVAHCGVDSGHSGGGSGKTVGPVKIILAGEGRMCGIGARNRVGSGALLAIHQPAWDVGLKGTGDWTVVCDWSLAEDVT